MTLRKFRRGIWTAGLVTGLVLIVVALGSLLGTGRQSVSALGTCTANNIMHCGATSPANFISKVRSDNGGTEPDLKAIYAAYGLSPSDYDRFASSAKAGTAYQDGRIVVDGKTVATDAVSIGRVAASQGSGYFTQTIDGHQYYGNTNDKAYQGPVPVWVLMDGSSNMQFAVVGTLCGNPMKGTPPKPAPKPRASCTGLNASAESRTTFVLRATATTSGGATISGYDFAVSQANQSVASRQVSSTAANASADVTLDTPGNYAATVTVHTSVGDKTGTACTANLTVAPKPVSSVTITKDVDGVKQEQVAVGQQFVYHVRVTNDGKVDLKNVLVNDTPPPGVTLINAELGTITSNAWSYTIPSLNAGESKRFALTAKVPAYMAGDLINTACVNAPGVPNQPLCDTATVTVTPPATPTPPPELPNTGAGNVIGFFVGFVATGFAAYRFFLSYRFGTKPYIRS